MPVFVIGPAASELLDEFVFLSVSEMITVEPFHVRQLECHALICVPAKAVRTV